MQFSFRKPHFGIPKILQKHYFGTMWHDLCFLNMPKKHYNGENSENKLGPVLTLDLDQFWTLETPNLGPVFNCSIYVYMYMYVCIYI